MATVIIIAIAHTISWIAYGTRTTNGVMIQVHRELEEAGKVAGASSARVLGRIVLPLIAAGIFNSWIWISMLSYARSLCPGSGHKKKLVISTIVWQFWGNGWVPQVAALGVLLVLFACWWSVV
jgi:iron(III) transport system permease protein